MQQKVADGVDDSDFPGVWTVLKAPQVSDRYKREIAEQIISFTGKKYEAGCLTGLDHKLLSAAARRMLMQYLTEEHLYETAYRMAEECGYEHMDTAACVSLCSYAIHTAGFEEDDFLLGFAEHVFYRGTYNINGDIIGSCAALTEIKVSGNNTRYQVKDNVLYEKNGKTVIYLYCRTLLSLDQLFGESCVPDTR